MIRIYSSNFTAQDYQRIADILYNGFYAVWPKHECIKRDCSKNCPNYKVCKAVLQAHDFCLKKVKELNEMVES